MALLTVPSTVRLILLMHDGAAGEQRKASVFSVAKVLAVTYLQSVLDMHSEFVHGKLR